MRRGLFAGVLLLLVLTAVSCQPFRYDDSAKYDVVLTLYDKTAAFDSYATFAMPDELVEIGDDIDVTHEYDAQIIARIRGNLLARGYTEVSDPETADLVVLPGVTTTEYSVSGCYYWWDYWCWYYPCYPGGGWCYPAPGSGYTYTVGTIVVLMLDRESIDPDAGTGKVLWTATLGGLLKGSITLNTILTNVDQAFLQSPYLSRQ